MWGPRGTASHRHFGQLSWEKEHRQALEKKETHIDPEILCVCVCVCVGGGHCHKVYFEPFKAMDSDGIECVKTTANCALVWLNFTRTFGAMNMS